MDRSDNKNKNNIDLSRFGLANTDTHSVPEVETIAFASGGYQPANHNELFAGEVVFNFIFIVLYLARDSCVAYYFIQFVNLT